MAAMKLAAAIASTHRPRSHQLSALASSTPSSITPTPTAITGSSHQRAPTGRAWVRPSCNGSAIAPTAYRVRTIAIVYPLWTKGRLGSKPTGEQAESDQDEESGAVTGDGDRQTRGRQETRDEHGEHAPDDRGVRLDRCSIGTPSTTTWTPLAPVAARATNPYPASANAMKAVTIADRMVARYWPYGAG